MLSIVLNAQDQRAESCGGLGRGDGFGAAMASCSLVFHEVYQFLSVASCPAGL